MIRRNFIKALGLSPLAALISSGPAPSPVQVTEPLKTAVEPSTARNLTKFSEFMTKQRRDGIEREAFDRLINNPFDPDIGEMKSWSTTTKRRAQLDRWRQYIIRANRTWFEDVVDRHGFFTDYSDDL